MKLLFTVFTLVILSQSLVFSQDTIIKTDNTIIISIVLELNDSVIKYKRFNMEDGPLYIIDKKEIKHLGFYNINNRTLVEYNKQSKGAINDSILKVKLKEYQELRKLLLAETKQSPNLPRNGWHIGINRSTGLNHLNETYNKRLDGDYYGSEESYGTTHTVGVLTRNYINNKFSVKSGALISLLKYGNTGINELSVPIALSVHFGRKVAFIGELGASFNFPYKKTINTLLHIERNNLYYGRIKALALNQTAHLGILLYFSRVLSMDIGLDQMYSSISFYNFDSRELRLCISACLYYNLNS